MIPALSRQVLLLAALLALCAGAPARAAATGKAPDKSALSKPTAALLEKAQDVAIFALGLIGVDYHFGGETPASGVDCSGLVRYVFSQTTGISLPRTSAQMGKVRAVIRQEQEQAYGPATGSPVPGTVPRPGAPLPDPPMTHRQWLKSLLRSRRIRTHLFSGIEFEMAVFIVGPLTGWVIGTSIVAGVLLTGFELRLVYFLWRATRRHARWRAGRAPLVRELV